MVSCSPSKRIQPSSETAKVKQLELDSLHFAITSRDSARLAEGQKITEAEELYLALRATALELKRRYPQLLNEDTEHLMAKLLLGYRGGDVSGIVEEKARMIRTIYLWKQGYSSGQREAEKRENSNIVFWSGVGARDDQLLMKPRAYRSPLHFDAAMVAYAITRTEPEMELTIQAYAHLLHETLLWVFRNIAAEPAIKNWTIDRWQSAIEKTDFVILSVAEVLYGDFQRRVAVLPNEAIYRPLWSAEVFVDVFSERVGEISDYVLSLTMGSSEYDAHTTFLLNHIGEYVAPILPDLRGVIMEAALPKWYELTLPMIENEIKRHWTGRVITHRAHQESRNVRFGDSNLSATSRVTLHANVSLGFDTAHIRLLVDHPQKKIVAQIPSAPFFLEATFRSIRTSSLKYKYRCPMSFEDIGAYIDDITDGDLPSNEDLNALKEEALNEELLRSISVATRRFSKAEVGNELDYIKYLISPLMVVPFSSYELVIQMP